MSFEIQKWSQRLAPAHPIRLLYIQSLNGLSTAGSGTKLNTCRQRSSSSNRHFRTTAKMRSANLARYGPPSYEAFWEHLKERGAFKPSCTTLLHPSRYTFFLDGPLQSSVELKVHFVRQWLSRKQNFASGRLTHTPGKSSRRTNRWI